MAAAETAKQAENEAVAQRKADEKKERKQLKVGETAASSYNN